MVIMMVMVTVMVMVMGAYYPQGPRNQHVGGDVDGHSEPSVEGRPHHVGGECFFGGVLIIRVIRIIVGCVIRVIVGFFSRAIRAIRVIRVIRVVSSRSLERTRQERPPKQHPPRQWEG